MNFLSNYIKLFLNIKDPNREINQVVLETINNVETKVCYCTLKLAACPYCHSSHVWHNGHVRVKVRYLSSDASQTVLLKLAKERFPNAQVILDRFHVVQMLNPSFNTCRIQVMKQYPKASRNYRLLKSLPQAL
ncbi:transposase [Lactobacillus sp. M0396]|uniref:transposase n=1 Tax=Lactobacillus sp. M0396 TaxID=2751030 RepID=UPI0018DD1464|nr:transposase [Lactobacillus sp. M0396]MBI0033964.1 transposase [Lactobacillus sp. M0396]